MNEEQTVKTKMTSKELTGLKEEIKKVSPSDRVEKPMKQRFFERWKIQRNAAKAKGHDKIAAFLINWKGQLEGPFSVPIYGGAFLVIRNHVYRYNPKRVLMWGKHKVIIVRWFDRDLVKINEDYDEIVAQGANKTPLDDPVLIKALIQANLKEKQGIKANKWIMWVIGGLVLAGVVYLFMKGGGSPTPTANVPK